MMRSRKIPTSSMSLFIALTMLAIPVLGLTTLASPQNLATRNAYVIVKRGDKRTTIRFSGSAGRITKVEAVEKDRSIEFPSIRTGATSVLSCSAEARKCDSVLQRGEKKLTACACLEGKEKISLIPAGEKQTAASFFRFFGDLDGGGGSGEQECWESEELQMSICEP